MANESIEYRVTAGADPFMRTGCGATAIIRPPIEDAKARGAIVQKAQTLARRQFGDQAVVRDEGSVAGLTSLHMNGLHTECGRSRDKSHNDELASAGSSLVIRAMGSLGYRVRAD